MSTTFVIGPGLRERAQIVRREAAMDSLGRQAVDLVGGDPEPAVPRAREVLESFYAGGLRRKVHLLTATAWWLEHGDVAEADGRAAEIRDVLASGASHDRKYLMVRKIMSRSG